MAETGGNPFDWSSLAASGINTIGNLFGVGLSQRYNEKNMQLQSDYAKALMDYQWNNYNSPEAQIKSMTKAGLNPAVMLSGGKSSFAAPSVNMPSSAPISVPNILDMSVLSSFIKSVADAKKAGMDTKLSEQEIKNKQIEQQVNEFELSIKKQFSSEKESVSLAQAYRNLLLASDAHDINEQTKALNEWKKATEKALSEAKEHERDILRLRLENTPVAIELENQLGREEIKTEQSKQASNYSQVEVNRELRRLNSALADVEENTKADKISALISEYRSRGVISEKDAKEASLQLSRIMDIQDKRSSYFFKEIDSLTEWLKGKVSIFH